MHYLKIINTDLKIYIIMYPELKQKLPEKLKNGIFILLGQAGLYIYLSKHVISN